MSIQVKRTVGGLVIWTNEIDNFIRDCISKRMSRSKIAAELGVTRNALIGRAWRMKM
jgi:hypothetical protein